ncbi:hypothetical protein GHV35_17705 [Acinetobacter baumannii]|nr:hypothetical protein [Acinetobacter baumannii]
MDNVAQLETDTNFQSRKKITWGVFSVLLLFLVAGILYYFSLYTTNFTEPLSYQGSAFLKLPKFP